MRIWPGVLGALLDGVVGAIRDRNKIRVDDPARMMDFERFAEAGCCAMGFREWEFVDAYAANRMDLLSISARSSGVGRLVIEFLKLNRDGFQGSMEELYARLDPFKHEIPMRQWPVKLHQTQRPIAQGR